MGGAGTAPPGAQRHPAGARRTYSRTVFSDRALTLRWRFTSPAEKREVERELVERSDNGALPLVIVPYFDPTGSTNAPPSEGESAVILGHLDPDWPVRYVRPTELEGEAVVAEAAFPAVDEVA